MDDEKRERLIGDFFMMHWGRAAAAKKHAEEKGTLNNGVPFLCSTRRYADFFALTFAQRARCAAAISCRSNVQDCNFP